MPTSSPLDRPNFTQVPNVLLGDRRDPGLMASMGYAEVKTFLCLCRLTFGFHQGSARVSLTTLQQMTGLSRQAVIGGLASLLEAGVVEKLQDGKVNEYRLLVASLVTRPPQDQQSSKNTVLVQQLDQSSQVTRPPSVKETPERNPLKETWILALKNLRGQFTAPTYNQYFSGSSLFNGGNGTLILRVQNEPARSWIDKRLRPKVEKAIHEAGIMGDFSLSIEAPGG